MRAKFDVLREPWIPTRSCSGRLAEKGILETLRTAHELVAVEDASPAFQFGLYRLLVAFVSDAMRIRRQGDLEKLLQRGHFDIDRLEQYAVECGDCFDLFGAQRPFLQAAAADDEAGTSVAALFQHLPSGTNAIHFHHGLEGDQAISPAVCARALSAIAPFMTMGGKSKSPSINGIPPWYVLVRGRNLFETLVLNCVALPMPWRRQDDRPSWASSDSVEPKKRVKEFGLLEGLTWRPRLVHLVPNAGGRCTYSGRDSQVLVRCIAFRAGLRAVVEGGRWVDPNVAYRIAEKGRFPIRPQEDRPLWRDTGRLMLLQEQDLAGDAKDRFERPLVITQFAQLNEWGLPATDRSLRIECYGMRTDQMKVSEWQSEILSLPAEVLRNRKAGVQVHWAMELSKEVAYDIRKSITKAYPRGGGSNSKAFGGLITTALADFWDRLRPRFENEFLSAVAQQQPGDVNADAQLQALWFEIMLREAPRALDRVLDCLNENAQALRRQVEAGDLFWNRLIRKRPGRNAADVGPTTRRTKKQTMEPSENAGVPAERGQSFAAGFGQRLAELNRGDLAVLKRNCGNTLAQSRDALPVFYRSYRKQAGDSDEELYFLVATLYAFNQRTGSGNFGRAMKMIKRAGGSQEALDRRMSILLDSEPERLDGGRSGGGELAYRLRQCVKLAALNDVGIDWVRLVEDLRDWDDPSRRIRKQWAREYFGQATSPQETMVDSSPH